MRILSICLCLMCMPVLAGTLCKSSEKVVFSCQIKNTSEIASVCSSSALTHDEGYLQYRYGTPRNVELVFPPTKRRTQSQFYWGKIIAYGGSDSELSFISGGYLYTLGIGGESEEVNGISGGTYGGYIQITKLGNDSNAPKILDCAGTPRGPFELSNVVRDDAELIGR